jgi:hypothetical protein
MLETALKKLSNKVVKPVEWENEYRPRVTTGDMKRFWDNIDTQRLERLSDIKANKL